MTRPRGTLFTIFHTRSNGRSDFAAAMRRHSSSESPPMTDEAKAFRGEVRSQLGEDPPPMPTTHTTKAYAAFDNKSPLGPFEAPRREPRADDVTIDILYCGICHSD